MHQGLIVFSHGNSFPAGTYGFMLNALKARGYVVEAIECLGHDPRYPITSNWPCLFEELRDFTKQALQTHGQDRAWLVGHSLGGFLSLMTMLREPRMVHGVVMLDSPVIAGWRARLLALGKRSRWAAHLSPGAVSQKRRAHWPSRTAVFDHFKSKRAFASWHPDVLRDYVDHGTRVVNGGPDDPEQPTARELVFDRLVETAIYNTLPHTLGHEIHATPATRPVSFVGGTKSRELRQVGLAATRRLVRERLHWVQGTHHFPMEAPLETAQTIEQAIASMRDA